MSERKRPRGRPPKLGEFQPFPLRLPTELHRELTDKAKDLGISLNDLIVQISVSWLEKEKGK